jgi:hypothetical protein
VGPSRGKGLVQTCCKREEGEEEGVEEEHGGGWLGRVLEIVLVEVDSRRVVENSQGHNALARSRHVQIMRLTTKSWYVMFR